MRPARVEIEEYTQLDRDELTRLWRVVLAGGVITAAVGLAIIVWPKTGLFAIAVLVASGLVITGVTELASAKRWRQRWVPITCGVASLAAGLATVVWPDITLWVLAVLLGASLLVRGFFRVVGSLTDRPPMWGLFAGIGAAEAVLGLLALSWPDATLVVVALLMGINLLLAGLVEIAFAVKVKALAQDVAT